MKSVWLDQLWSAVSGSVAVSLIISLEEEEDEEFNKFLNVSSNVSTAMGLVGTAMGQTVGAVARSTVSALGSLIEDASARLAEDNVELALSLVDFGAIREQAAGKTAKSLVEGGSTKEAVADVLEEGIGKRAAQEASSALSPLREAKNVYLLKDTGDYEEITSTWRKMMAKAASQRSVSAEKWMTDYANLLAKKGGLAVKVGDAAPAEMGGMVRRAVHEAQWTAMDEANREIAELVGYDGVQVSAHSQCADDHLPYQGKVYSLEEFELINDSLTRPIGKGVMNCRHTLTYCDKDKRSAYSDELLAQYEEDSHRTVTYTGRSGKELSSTAYEASQYLRGCESNIRKLKMQRLLLSTAGGDTSQVEASITAATKHYRKLCRQLGENYSSARIAVYTLD